VAGLVSMAKVIKFVCGVDGRDTPLDGRFLVAYSADSLFGDLAVDTTDDIAKAQRFADVVEVHKIWRAVSKLEPRRPDGKWNRPITGMTIEILEAAS
jgi:hypothetical protein